MTEITIELRKIYNFTVYGTRFQPQFILNPKDSIFLNKEVESSNKEVKLAVELFRKDIKTHIVNHPFKSFIFNIKNLDDNNFKIFLKMIRDDGFYEIFPRSRFELAITSNNWVYPGNREIVIYSL